ncbi:hypothetical protein C7W88_12770 [Novosphingobium sp. THN1]|uniref:hypothetical protein n=1 Tax=Novosphingobium sp. THN1 TaxID=1016987 RepID=UPI000E546BF6|nr:hypothetical protein [Novosphingobium sp. THN1]AXU19698.1 hypothetical protein C7W88_12770 [Novosphingobium sp. THN1]
MLTFLIRHWRIVSILAAALALYAAFRWYVAGEIEQARKDDAAAVQRIDAIADDVAGQVAASQAATVEQENRDARQAASDSDDPLRAGLDRLRAGKTGSR